MAINLNLPDFLHMPTQQGFPDIFGEILRGYKIAQEPHIMRRKAEQEELANRLAQMKNEYYPREAEANIGLTEAHTGLTNEQIQERKIANALSRQFGISEREAEIALKRAQAQFAGKTSTQRELGELYGHGTPEYESALKAIHGIYEPRQESLGSALEEMPNEIVVERHVPFSALPKNEQLDVSKRMRNDLRSAYDIKKADITLQEMRKLVLDNPNLSNSFSNIFIDPTSSSTINKFKKSVLNQEQRSAIEKFTKLSNDLILQAGQGLGAKNFTDAKLKVLELAKPSGLNTAEANLFLIDKMRDEFAPWTEYADALKKGLENRYIVEFDLDKYSNRNMNRNEESQPSSLGELSDEDLDRQLGSL